MASVSHVKITATHEPSPDMGYPPYWYIEVTYVASFTAQEVAHEAKFHQCFVLKERDPGSDEKFFGGHCVDGSDFQAIHTTMHRTMHAQLADPQATADPDGHDADGIEDLYAIVHLRNLSASGHPLVEGKSPILELLTA
jgi:hypothetical protein